MLLTMNLKLRFVTVKLLQQTNALPSFLPSLPPSRSRIHHAHAPSPSPPLLPIIHRRCRHCFSRPDGVGAEPARARRGWAQHFAPLQHRVLSTVDPLLDLP